MPETFIETVFATRLGERIALTAIIVIATGIVMIGFWRCMSRINFDLPNDKLGSANVVLATPVLTLLALVGFAWISFSNPITVESRTTGSAPAESPDGGAQAAAGSLTRAVGATPVPAAKGPLTRAQALDHIATLNCFHDSANPLQAPSIEAAKTALILSVWDPAWGDAEAFANARATGSPSGVPVVEVYLQDTQPC